MARINVSHRGNPGAFFKRHFSHVCSVCSITRHTSENNMWLWIPLLWLLDHTFCISSAMSHMRMSIELNSFPARWYKSPARLNSRHPLVYFAPNAATSSSKSLGSVRSNPEVGTLRFVEIISTSRPPPSLSSWHPILTHVPHRNEPPFTVRLAQIPFAYCYTWQVNCFSA